MDPRKSSFPPVADERTRVLVLGSLPGEQSLAARRYYAHPRNHFWPLIGRVIGADLMPLKYEGRLEALLDAGVGLWDTVGSATRRGSLDGAIRDAEENDLTALVATLPGLRAIGFNGAKSAALGTRQLRGEERIALIPLPSSSPAFTLPLEEKLRSWRALETFL